MRRTAIKFCGCRTERDVAHAAYLGADAIGFVFAPSSRRVSYAVAERLLKLVPPDILPVAVFVDPTPDDIARLQDMRADIALQLPAVAAGDLQRTRSVKLIQTLHVSPQDTVASLEATFSRADESVVLFDTKVPGRHGGTGRTFAWSAIAPLTRRKRCFIAGGLHAENVAACVRALRPFGVDVSSGIETSGTKDAAKMRQFIDAVRSADAD